MNNVVISGNLGKAPELKDTTTGKVMANFSVALYCGKDRDGEPKTLWVNCTAWERAAEQAGRMDKGTPVVVSGRMDCYKNREGQMVMQLSVQEIQRCERYVRDDTREATPRSGAHKPSGSMPPDATAGVGDDDIPF